MIKHLIRLANHLDSKGLSKEADYLDAAIRKLAAAPALALPAAASIATDLGVSILVVWRMYKLWSAINPDSDPIGFLSADHSSLQKQVQDSAAQQTDDDDEEERREYDAVLVTDGPARDYTGKVYMHEGRVAYPAEWWYEFYPKGTVSAEDPGHRGSMTMAMGRTESRDEIWELTSDDVCGAIGHDIGSASYTVYIYSSINQRPDAGVEETLTGKCFNGRDYFERLPQGPDVFPWK